MALSAWAGVFQGALHSEAGAALFPSDTFSARLAGKREVQCQCLLKAPPADSILYGSAKLQLSREDTALGHDFVGRTPMYGC